jgi:hypothetical protein
MGRETVSKRGVSTTSIADTLAFPFRSDHATNRLLAGVGLLFLSIIIPVLPALVVYGYLIQIMRQVIDGQPARLPEWKDWGALFVDGLKAVLVGLVYLLPGMLAFMIGLGAYCGSSLLLFGLSENTSATSGADGVFAALLVVSMVALFLSFSIGAILSLLGALPIPAAEARLSESKSFGSAFALGRLYAVIKANPGGYIVAWLLLAGMWAFMTWGLMVAYYTLVLACLMPLLILPVSFYSLLVAAALFGEAYRDGAANLSGTKGG